MGKLIFFDIDGTLKMPGLSPRPAVVQAIRMARSKGHKVFLSTGRLECDVPDYIHDIGFDGGIYSAGGRIVVDQKAIWDQPLPTELIRQIVEALRDKKLFYILEASSSAYSGQSWRGYPYMTYERYASIKSRLHLLEPEERPAVDPIYKITFIAPLEVSLETFIEGLGSVAKVVIFPARADSDLLPFGEISSPEIHKGRALLHICRHLGASPKDCIAFGDSMNDVEILHAAGLGIAVGNADDELKQIADEICGSFAEDGIAIALKKMQLI